MTMLPVFRAPLQAPTRGSWGHNQDFVRHICSLLSKSVLTLLYATSKTEIQKIHPVRR